MASVPAACALRRAGLEDFRKQSPMGGAGRLEVVSVEAAPCAWSDVPGQTIAALVSEAAVASEPGLLDRHRRGEIEATELHREFAGILASDMFPSKINEFALDFFLVARGDAYGSPSGWGFSAYASILIGEADYQGKAHVLEIELDGDAERRLIGNVEEAHRHRQQYRWLVRCLRLGRPISAGLGRGSGAGLLRWFRLARRRRR